jgi:cell division protein FtsQ
MRPADGIVLPRLLRRPARMLGRLCDGDFAIPRFSASLLSAALLGAAGTYGAILGGHLPGVVQFVTARSGFAVDEVKIAGHHEISEIDILDRLALDGWTSMIGFDAERARDSIVRMAWVDTASVRKIYPDTLEVEIEERKPFAIWQHGRQLTLVDASGGVIAPFTGNRHASLPLIIGMGAPERAEAFIAKVARFPELAARVKGYIHVAERRWDLRLENGVTVRLPEREEHRAIADLLALDRENGLLSRDIAAVDMRLDDRLVVQLTPQAVLRRNAALKERGKGAGRPEKKI